MQDHIRERLIDAIKASGRTPKQLATDMGDDLDMATIRHITMRKHHPTTFTASIIATYFGLRLS